MPDPSPVSERFANGAGCLSRRVAVAITPGPEVDQEPVGAWEHLRSELQSILDDPDRAATSRPV